jgi:endoglucanase
MSDAPWKLTPQQVIETPEISVLIFHNVYPEGKQGGVEIIQHGERVATNGDLRLEPAPGQWAPLPKPMGRAVDEANGMVSVQMAFTEPAVQYTVRVWSTGDQIELAVDLDQPLPDEWAEKVGFNLELLPSALFGKTYFMDDGFGTFPRQANGPVARLESGALMPTPLALGKRLVAAPEDPLHRLEIRAHQGDLLLLDGRDMAQNGWFVVRTNLPGGVTRDAVRWTLTPNRVSGWQREPVILVSQVGYHPDQEKQALIELDPRMEQEEEQLDEAVLLRLSTTGEHETVLRARPELLGRFLRYAYARFDFSSVDAPGMYLVRYGQLETMPFKISREVYQEGVWQPTLESYLPVQMCHMRVEDLQRVWHGACHLDDAIQAPANHEHFDGYRQYAELEAGVAEFAHIPELNRGGWHDAGDYDLAAGSQASTTYMLALAREAFGVDSDQTTVQREARLVRLQEPDGVPDIVQQVAHGVENLLSGYRAAGHSFAGIIEGTLEQYTHLGDAATMTDNLVYDPSLEANTVKEGRSSKRDDRLVFTNRNTALEYTVAAALAAASRVLRGYEDDLAEECLTTARRVWEFEHSHAVADRPNVYFWNNPQAAEVVAAVELLLTTGDETYARRLAETWQDAEAQFERMGWLLARALPTIQDQALRDSLRKSAERYRDRLQEELDASPFGLPFGDGWLRANRPDHNPFAEDYHPPIWGVGWSLQSFAVHYYYLVRAFPEMFNREPLLRVLNYVLGWHPANNLSLVSGVGAQSLTIAYGTNRAEWSYQPGGIASGPALILPDTLELMDPFPWLWQQKEYVIGGASSYIFLVLAADDLLNR